MTVISDIDTTEIVIRWLGWAASAKNRAHLLMQHGDRFDASLKIARGQVRAEAAVLLRETPDAEKAAALMMQRAVAASVRTPPMVGYDEAAVSYTRARTWQACAWELYPGMHEVQPRWA